MFGVCLCVWGVFVCVCVRVDATECALLALTRVRVFSGVLRVATGDNFVEACFGCFCMRHGKRIHSNLPSGCSPSH